MVLKNLIENIEAEKTIARDIFVLASQLQNIEKITYSEKGESEKAVLEKTIASLITQLRIINNSIPEILTLASPYRKISADIEKKEKTSEEQFIRLEYLPKSSDKKIYITINKNEESKFLKNFKINRIFLKRLKMKSQEKEEKIMELRKTSPYAKLANKIFLPLSNKIISKGYFKKLNLYLRKANMSYLFATYISIIFLNSSIAFIIALMYFISSLFFSVTLAFPFFTSAVYTYQRILLNIAVLLITPVATFFIVYYYPYLESSSIGGKIDREIPFVTMHMSAIAGGGIEPSQIFKIVAFGEEYPETKKEMRKIINQLNLYGYDLVTALKNTARETSSKKFSELLNGLSITISGGGDLRDFLNKRSETLLFEDQIEKQKETRSSETFMDLYISLVVTTPMVMTLLLVLISVGMGGVSLSPKTLALVMVLIIALINSLFLLLLHFRKISY